MYISEDRGAEMSDHRYPLSDASFPIPTISRSGELKGIKKKRVVESSHRNALLMAGVPDVVTNGLTQSFPSLRGVCSSLLRM